MPSVWKMAARPARSLERSFTRLLGLRPMTAGQRTLFKIDQVEALNKLRLVALVAIFLGALIVFKTLAAAGHEASATAWFAVVLAMVVVDILSGPGLAMQRPSREEVRAQYWRSVAAYFVFGLLWGALPLLFYQEVSEDVRRVILVAITAYLASSAFFLAALPLAFIAFSTPIVVFFAATLIRSGVAAHAFELQLLCIYVLAFPIALRQYAVSFAERSLALAKVGEQKQLISLLLNDFEANSSDWLWQCDSRLRLLRVSDHFAQRFGMALGELDGRRFDHLLADLKSPAPCPGDRREDVLVHLQRGEPFRDCPILLVIDGEEHWWSMTGTPTYDRAGRFDGFRGMGRDIGAEKARERELEYLAHHDTLTGVGNRARFNHELARARGLTEAGGRRFALVLFDLDDFKAINDTAGHSVGDQVLRTTSRRIAGFLPRDSFLSRIGGDEFAAIVEIKEDLDPARLRDIVGKVVHEVARPLALQSGSYKVGVSAGIAIMPDDGQEPEQLMQLADIALYCAKAGGKDQVKLASSEDGAAFALRKQLELDLWNAVEKEEMFLEYQPVASARTGEPFLFEALVRWRHPRLGVIPPAEFIDLAEQSGSIVGIGGWALATACREAAGWPAELRIAVNISPRQLEAGDFPAWVAAVLEETGLAPGRLEVEITESAYRGGLEPVAAVVADLHTLGVTVAMDDFGTGYSSLSSLQRIPFDKLKIDQSLVVRGHGDKRAVSVLRSIVTIGRALGMHVTAEGVETAEHEAFLRGIGVDSLQGFYFGPPLSAKQAMGLIKERFGRNDRDRASSVA